VKINAVFTDKESSFKSILRVTQVGVSHCN